MLSSENKKYLNKTIEDYKKILCCGQKNHKITVEWDHNNCNGYTIKNHTTCIYVYLFYKIYDGALVVYGTPFRGFSE